MRPAKMIIISILAAILVCSCGIKTTDSGAGRDTQGSDAPATRATVDTAAQTETKAPESPKAKAFSVGALYNMTSYNAGVRETYEKVSAFRDDRSGGRDLCVLAGFPSSKNELAGKDMAAIWNACLEENGLAATTRAGYLLEFDTPEGKCAKLILRPSDVTEEKWDYIETYIYDDIRHAGDGWYSHLLNEEFTDETIVSSVKITAGDKIGDVTNLTLTVFLYDLADRELIDESFARTNGFTSQIAVDPAR